MNTRCFIVPVAVTVLVALGLDPALSRPGDHPAPPPLEVAAGTPLARPAPGPARPLGARPGDADDAGPAEVLRIDRLARVYGPVSFAHRAHAEMAQLDAGCATCHHGAETGGPIAACITCHPAFSSETSPGVPGLRGAYHRQCLGCHRDWAHENACGFCHDAAEPGAPAPPSAPALPAPRIGVPPVLVYRTGHQPAPAVTFQHGEHARAYGLRCTDCHAGDSCGSCHDEGAVRIALDRHQRCLGCHTEDRCQLCHDRAVRPVAHHQVPGSWPLGPQHAKVPCAACHGGPGVFRVPPTACRGCHQGLEPGAFDHAATGVPLLGSHAWFACDRCHRSGVPGAIARCDGCHANRAYPADLPGAQ